MHVLDTGRYTITNAKYGNVAVLYDGNEDSEVVAGYQEDKPGEKVLHILLLTSATSLIFITLSVECCTSQQQKLHHEELWPLFVCES
jgi:hypothetical protein